MNPSAKLLTAVAFACALAIVRGRAAAQTAPPLPTPSPSATPSGPSDPCGSILSIVNRPTFGTGVCTVQTGHFDVENGYTNTVTTGTGGGSTANYPQTLLRVGTFDPHLDVEFSFPSVNNSSGGGSNVTGSTDIGIGAKYEIGYTSKFLYGASTIVTIPTGTPAFSAGNAQFEGSFNWAYTIDSEFGIAGSLAANAFSGYNSGGNPQSYFAFVPTILGTAALPGGPSQLFGEYAYFSHAGPNLGGKSWFDFGYQRDFGPHVQFDVEYGFSPTVINGQKQHYVGAGLSFMN
jgi:hypothetical protein